MMKEIIGLLREHEPAIEETVSVSQFAARAVTVDVDRTASLAARALLEKQHDEGYWVADLTADTTLLSDYILLQMWLYPPAEDGSWNPPTLLQIRKSARSIIDAQKPDGGWSIYEPGPSEINATVRAYTMLKMTGMNIEDPHL